ncbi:MAG: SufE family protein [Alphaproteobacteria bacterium]|nr:SufE family protein [Alphaproteobacteria bacterium]
MTYDEIKNILSQITDPVERLEFVMDIGKSLAPIPEGMNPCEIKGCASRVEIYRDADNNYFGTADSAIVRGLVAIILSMVQGKSPDEIKGMNLENEIAALDLQLGAGRMNGVHGIISFLKGL